MRTINVLLSLLLITSCNQEIEQVTTIEFIKERPSTRFEISQRSFSSLVIKSNDLTDTLKVGYLYGDPGYKIIKHNESEYLWLAESVNGGGVNKLYYSLFSMDSINFLDTIFHRYFVNWDEFLWIKSRHNQYELSLIGVDTNNYHDQESYYTEKTFDIKLQNNSIDLVIDSVIIKRVSIPDPENEFSHRNDTLVQGQRLISNIEKVAKKKITVTAVPSEYECHMCPGYILIQKGDQIDSIASGVWGKPSKYIHFEKDQRQFIAFPGGYFSGGISESSIKIISLNNVDYLQSVFDTLISDSFIGDMELRMNSFKFSPPDTLLFQSYTEKHNNQDESSENTDSASTTMIIDL